MDTNYLHTEAWARAFEEVGHRTPRAEIHKQIGKGSDKLIPEFVEDERKGERADELHGELYLEMQEHGHPLPGARELIANLAERGYQIWFVTSAKPEELEQYLEQLETEGRISGIVNSSDVENSKPAPDIFELALEEAGATSDIGRTGAVPGAARDGGQDLRHRQFQRRRELQARPRYLRAGPGGGRSHVRRDRSRGGRRLGRRGGGQGRYPDGRRPHRRGVQRRGA